MPEVVKIRYAINFALACAEAGLAPQRLLKSVDIDERLLENPENMISEHQLWTLASGAATATGKFDIGLDAGQISSVLDHGSLRILFGESSVFERLVTFCDLAKLEYSRADFFVQPVWNGIVFGRRAIVGDREQIRQVELYILNLMLETVRSSLGSTWEPKILNLQSDYHVQLEALAQSANSKLRFSQPETQIFIDRREVVSSLLQDLNSVDNAGSDSTVQSVSELIRTYLFDPRLSLTFIARLFAENERYLQRELQKEGANFSELLSRERNRSARELLTSSGKAVSEVSAALGYSNQAHFTRAFLRATGMTPTAFKRTVRCANADE